MTDQPERAPVQGEATNCRRGGKPRGTISWAEHVEAWTEYHRHHHEQDAITIASRGGFGYWEATDLLGHEPTSWERSWRDEATAARAAATRIEYARR